MGPFVSGLSPFWPLHSFPLRPWVEATPEGAFLEAPAWACPSHPGTLGAGRRQQWLCTPSSLGLALETLCDACEGLRKRPEGPRMEGSGHFCPSHENWRRPEAAPLGKPRLPGLPACAPVLSGVGAQSPAPFPYLHGSLVSPVCPSVSTGWPRKQGPETLSEPLLGGEGQSST